MTSQSSTASQPRSVTCWGVALLGVGAALLAAGCSPAERPSEKGPAEPTYSAPPAPAAPPGRAGAKASAGNGSEEEIFAALSRAGVPDPAKWTDQVIRARPYPPADPNLTKLRTALAPQNPGPGVVDKIVSALSP